MDLAKDEWADVARTQAFADNALAQIRGRRLAGTPRNFEIWYEYVSGYNADLSDAINSILKSRAVMTQDEMEQLYDRFLSPMRHAQRVDTINTRMIDELSGVLSLLATASESSQAYRADLSGAESRLDALASPEGLRGVIHDLVAATRRVEETNRALEVRLRQSRSEIEMLQSNLDAVRAESLTDPLTSLANRKFYDQCMARYLAEADEGAGPFALVVTDIDHFKKFNDTFGHLTGDQVLRLVAQAVKQNVKGFDMACRVGGEEFAIILPQTGLRDAVTVAEHIRRAVMTKELVKRSTGENLGRITISLGVSVYRLGDTAASLYERADQCLYAAKRGGRNRVVCESDPEVSPVTAKVA